MGIIGDLKKFIYEEEVRYRSAISESTWFKIAGAINFILNRNHQEKAFYVNGEYSEVATPHIFEDGIAIFNFDAEIINAYAFNLVSGTSGDTELDIKIKPQLSGSWTSIFTTKPKINFAAGEAWIGIGDTVPNCVAPVLTSFPLQVNKGDAIRLDMLQAQVGGQNCGLLVHYRPR